MRTSNATSESSIYGRADDTLAQIQKDGEGGAEAGDSLYSRTQSAQDVIQKDGEGFEDVAVRCRGTVSLKDVAQASAVER